MAEMNSELEHEELAVDEINGAEINDAELEGEILEDDDLEDNDLEDDDLEDDDFEDEDEDGVDDSMSESADDSATSLDARVAELVDESQARPSGITLPTLPITGEPRVDDALARLGDLAGMPVGEHVEVFEDVHRRLHGTLADLAG